MSQLTKEERERLAAEIEKRMSKSASIGNLPTESEFTGDKVPSGGPSEKSELDTWAEMEKQSITDRKSEQKEHNMGTAVLSKDQALEKLSSLLGEVASVKTKLAEAEEEGEELLESIPDDEPFADIDAEEPLPELDDETFEGEEEEEEEESKYEDLTPKEVLDVALEDIQEAVEHLEDVEPELIEASRRIRAGRFASRHSEAVSGIIAGATEAVADAKDSLKYFKKLTKRLSTRQVRVSRTRGASPVGFDPDQIVDGAVKIGNAWTKLRGYFAEPVKAKCDKEEPKDKAKPKAKPKEKKEAAAYPPTDAIHTGDKVISPVPQEEELRHWHEGDARGKRDRSKETEYDLSNINDKIELLEKVKTLSSTLERSKVHASESRWIVRSDKGKSLGDVTFADVVDDKTFTRENYAKFLDPSYGEAMKIAVTLYGPKCLKSGFAALSPKQLRTVESFYKDQKNVRVATDENIKAAALNIVKAFETPQIQDKAKLVAYYTDAFGDAEFAKKLVNAMLATHQKLSGLIQVGAKYKTAYQNMAKRSNAQIRAKRAVDVAQRFASLGLIERDVDAIRAKAKEIASMSDDQFKAVLQVVGKKEDFETHMESSPESGIVANPLTGVRDPKSNVDTPDLQKEVKRDSKIASEDLTPEEIAEFRRAKDVALRARVAPQMTRSASELQPGNSLDFVQELFSTTPRRLEQAGENPEKFAPKYRR